MQGLLNQEQKKPENLAQGPQISPEQQEELDIFISNGISIIYDPKVSKGLIARILKTKDPVEAIADATLDIINKLEGSATSSKVNFSDTTLVHGANQLMAEIITLSETAGMKPLNEGQKEQAFTLAASKYIDRAIKSGKITPDQLQQMSQTASQTPQGKAIAQKVQAGKQGAAPPARAVPQARAAPQGQLQGTQPVPQGVR